MDKPRILDLFCGAGGSAKGLSDAGFEVVGVDIKPQPHYPFEFIQDDALYFLRFVNWPEFAAIWASPPCQAYMDTRKNGAKPSNHPRLIEPIRERLIATGKPYIIENVHKAPLKAALLLCGTMFGLRVIRHRYFELSFPAPMSPFTCNHWGQVASGDFVGVYAMGGRGHRHGRGLRDGPPEKAQVTAAEAMGVDWMTQRELQEAIPPAYSRFIGEQLMKVLTANTYHNDAL